MWNDSQQINNNIFIAWANLIEWIQEWHEILKDYLAIGLMSRVFTNGLEDRGSVPGQVIPKAKKMVLDATMLNT